MSAQGDQASAVNADHAAADREPTRAQIRRWRKHLAEERMEARTYRDLSERRTGEERAVLLQLEEAERRHEEYWLARLGERALPAPKPPLRTRAASLLAHLFGTIFILAMAQRAEQRSARDVDDDVPAHMQADEHIHAEVIRSLAAKSRETLAGTFRAAVFGANLALVLGVAASGMEPHAVLLTGVSGLLAGALSMGAGEWVSVRSQRELLDASIPDPDAHQAVPDLDVDANELALVFRARGESEEEAEAHAKQVFARLAKPATGESGAIAVRAALGDSPESDGAGDQVGTPMKAALSSFCFFATGAFFPLIPYILGLTGLTAIAVAAAIVGVALLFTGGVVGILSGQSPTPRALRQLVVGYGAAGVTYLLGLLFGTSVS